MRHTESRSRSSWSHYAKAAAVFTLTTATYLVARTTGWLPGWFLGNDEKTEDALALNSDFSVSSSTMSAPVKDSMVLSSLESKEVRELLTNFQSAILPISDSQQEDEIVIDAQQIKTSQRPLLQQSSGVIVVNPVPDQVIEEVGQIYRYPLDNVFSGNYTLLGVTQTGKTSLPGKPRA
jgi:hypothetical protein